jgi:hypothetical protein
MNVKKIITRKPELVVAVCAVYLTAHYANKAWQSRQARRRTERVDAQIAAVNATLDNIAKSFPQFKF